MKGISHLDSYQTPLPPDKMEIIDLRAEPYEDGKRVLVHITFPTFQKNPSAEILVYDPDGREVARVNIIETIDPNTEITIHLPPEGPKGEYRITSKAFYPQQELPENDMGNVITPEKIYFGVIETTVIISK
jgi:hypothetical protein